jgi:hypothetical protein
MVKAIRARIVETLKQTSFCLRLCAPYFYPDLDVFTDALRDTLQERPSSKHMAGLDLGQLEPTPSLSYREAA